MLDASGFAGTIVIARRAATDAGSRPGTATPKGRKDVVAGFASSQRLDAPRSSPSVAAAQVRPPGVRGPGLIDRAVVNAVPAGRLDTADARMRLSD
jgi:hypothetical protein